ncbi:Gfo/Idh/MocA family protein [Alicyclobacillus sp. ALC3]|uniref:Gfo/Idh/MocA family protein n=1 Tax=Alicyclobacillus sp. ALC3 TaxID=2796143 RepID=UPI002378082D|nr:Gfo/Idh/MocA family oxidoreductase [Alicyclobacillus sp. ALC3]WDL95654.1 Gfo/Idh/MocA family oxidoreductase [Alicyclobacillus sp. ALC3]
METLRWGIIGTARIAAEQVVPALNRARNTKLQAVASRSLDRAKTFARNHGIPSYYGSYDELLQDPEVDAVYISLPNHLHAQWSIRAAQSGKHILCEKPAVLHPSELTAVLNACREANVRYMEAFMYQLHPQWDRVLEILRSGQIGSVRSIRAAFTFPLLGEFDIRLQPVMGGGALYDVGCYCVHAIRRIVGDEEPSVVRAEANFSVDGIVDRTLSADLGFNHGVSASFVCSFEQEDRQDVVIEGSSGTLKVSHAFRPDLGKPTLSIQTAATLVDEPVPNADVYVLEVEHFSDGVFTGNPFRNTDEDVAANSRWIDRIYRAAGRRQGA